MRYVMKQQWLSWGDDFTIQDAEGHDAFFVDGQVLTFGDKLSFQDIHRWTNPPVDRFFASQAQLSPPLLLRR